MHIYPDYYKEFRCIANRCKHNCCIGWEIDIDSSTLDFYKSVTGNLGKRLKDNISYNDTPHFILSDNERCPFLNTDNLCDIIIEAGEYNICNICKEHPRFHNELPDRTESGLGLCCEEAARIILSKRDCTTLECNTNIFTDDEIIILRDNVMTVLQNRNHSIKDRLQLSLKLCNTSTETRSIKTWFHVLSTFEQLDKSWGELLYYAKENYDNINLSAFDTHIKDRQHEYEQFIIYLLYRHFANSPDIREAQSRLRFIDFAYNLIYTLGATIYHKNGDFSFDDQVELVRLFSSEIEYSDENLYTLFDMI